MKQEWIELCHSSDLDEGAAKEFHIDDTCRIFVTKKQGQFYGYYNVCPHVGWPLNLSPDVFLDPNKEFIQCSNHMAAFDITSGHCFAGPCKGASLNAATIKIVGNKILFQT